mgnify:CR=1 FL=1
MKKLKKTDYMEKCRINIAVIEPSSIVYEGFSTLLLKSEAYFGLFRVNDADELGDFISKENINVVICNPVVFQNRYNDFQRLRKQHVSVNWMALVYSYFDGQVLARFDEVIYISDEIDQIVEKLNNYCSDCHCREEQHEMLSGREIDVLILLVKGMSNKEIADKLSISIHTVNSHRKNIMEKTGIRSLAGLAIYAISKKIVPVDFNQA